jgi:hypothetical protein
MSSNDLECVNRRRIVLAIVTVWLVASVFLALGVILEPRVFALITPPGLQSYSGDTYYQTYVWGPQHRRFVEVASVSTALTIGLLSAIAIFFIWKRLGFRRGLTIIASMLMAVAIFLGIWFSPYVTYATPLVLTIYSLTWLPKASLSIEPTEKSNNWARISRAKGIILQIASFVLIAVLSLGMESVVASHFERIVRGKAFLFQHTIVWILDVAIPLDIVTLLVAGIITYATWSSIGASTRGSIIGGSLMVAIHLLDVSSDASLAVLASAIICIAWPRIRGKGRLGQTIVFVLLASILLIFSVLVYDYIAYGLFTRKEPMPWLSSPWLPPYIEQYDYVPTDSPIEWILAAAIPLIGGLVPYVIWRKMWGTSQKNALIIGNLMAIPVALLMSGAAVLALITGLLVYVFPLSVEKRIAVQIGITCLSIVALGLSWEGAFVMFTALGLYIIWLYSVVPAIESALVSPEPDSSDGS